VTGGFGGVAAVVLRVARGIDVRLRCVNLWALLRGDADHILDAYRRRLGRELRRREAEERNGCTPSFEA